MQQIAQTLANKGFEAPAQYTAQYFAINFDKTRKALRHKAFRPCTVLLHSIAQYRADLRISIHLLCKLLYKFTAQLCMLSNRVVGKMPFLTKNSDIFDREYTDRLSCLRDHNPSLVLNVTFYAKKYSSMSQNESFCVLHFMLLLN